MRENSAAVRLLTRNEGVYLPRRQELLTLDETEANHVVAKDGPKEIIGNIYECFGIKLFVRSLQLCVRSSACWHEGVEEARGLVNTI